MEQLEKKSPPDPWEEVSATAERIDNPFARSSLFFDFGETALEKGDWELAEKAVQKIEIGGLRGKLQMDIKEAKAAAEKQ